MAKSEGISVSSPLSFIKSAGVRFWLSVTWWIIMFLVSRHWVAKYVWNIFSQMICTSINKTYLCLFVLAVNTWYISGMWIKIFFRQLHSKQVQLMKQITGCQIKYDKMYVILFWKQNKSDRMKRIKSNKLRKKNWQPQKRLEIAELWLAHVHNVSNAKNVPSRENSHSGAHKWMSSFIVYFPFWSLPVWNCMICL